MTGSDEMLRQRVTQAWQDDSSEDAPAFDDVWRRAEAQVTTSRQQYARLAAVAVALGVVAAVFGVQSTVEQPQYIEMAELLNSTYCRPRRSEIRSLRSCHAGDRPWPINTILFSIAKSLAPDTQSLRGCKVLS